MTWRGQTCLGPCRLLHQLSQDRDVEAEPGLFAAIAPLVTAIAAQIIKGQGGASEFFNDS